jgi:Ca2+-binding RTX toxin-like protein
VVGVKRTVLLFAALGAAVIFFAYGPVTVNISISTGDDSTGGGEAIAATRTGTENADTLTGTANRDFLHGLGGNDTLSGLYGKDVIAGSEGDDTLYGNEDGDLVIGGRGVDHVYGGPNDDVIDTRDIYGDTPNGEADTADCGAGRGDFAFYDASDTLIGCENRSREWFVIQDTP